MNIFPGQAIPVLEQDTALQVYLDALLQDMSVSIYSENLQKLPIVEKIFDQDDMRGPMATSQNASVPCASEEHHLPEKSLAWATAPFQALLFSANGVKMVVPLVQLHSIVDLTAPLKAMPGNAEWFMGLWPWRGTHIKVVDICKFMAIKDAELKRAELNNPTKNPKRIVLINDGSWGFMCDEVSKIFTLSPEQVRWRANRPHRAWLVGTVLEHMCILLDVDGLDLRSLVGSSA